MAVKGTVKDDHIPVNKYVFAIVGLIPIVFTKISGITDEVGVITLPDRRKASGGTSVTDEFTATQPMHHTAEVAAMEVWYQENKDPITPTAKKPVTLTHTSGTGGIVRNYSLLGTWPSKRKLPDLEMENDGDMAEIEWTFQCDDILPL